MYFVGRGCLELEASGSEEEKRREMAGYNYLFGNNSSSSNSFLASGSHNSGLNISSSSSSSVTSSASNRQVIKIVSLPDTPEDTPEDYTTPPEVSDEINPNTNIAVLEIPNIKASLCLGFPNSTHPDTHNTVQLSHHDYTPGETNPNVNRALQEINFKASEPPVFPISSLDPENTVQLDADAADADDDDEGIQGDTELMIEDIAVAEPQSKDEDVDVEKGNTESLEFNLNSKENGTDLMMEDIDVDKGKTESEKLLVRAEMKEKVELKLGFRLNSKEDGVDLMKGDIDEGKGMGKTKSEKLRIRAEEIKHKGKSKLEFSLNSKENGADSKKFLMVALQLLAARNHVGAEDDDEPVDIIETAKKKGMTFPRNRYLK